MSNPTLVKVEDAAADEKIAATVLDETKYKALVANDAAKLVTINDLVYQDGSIASKTNINFKLGETKVVVRFEANGDSANIIAALKNIKAGDKISLENVNLSWFEGPQTIISLVSSVKVAELSTAEKIARVKAELEGNPIVIKKAGEGVALPTYDGVTITWSLEEGATACTLTEDKLGVIAATLPEADVELKAIARFTIDETAGTAEVSVTVKMAANYLTATASYAGSTTNMTGGNDAATIGLDATIFSAVSTKTGDNHVGLNKAGEIRLYSKKSSTLTITIAEGYEIVSITVNGVAASNMEVKAGEKVVAANGTSYDISGKVFSIANSSNSTIKIKSIEITYKAVA